MRKKIIKITGVFFVIAGVLVFSAFTVFSIERKKKDELYREVEVFSRAISIVQAEYVEETQPHDLIYGALKGMLSSLDPHSQFLDPETYNELKVETEGQFGGLGIEITIIEGLLTVISPIEDTPAWRAGIKPGDKIVKIDGEITRDLTLTDVVKKLRGKPNTEVSLTIWREKEDKLIALKIKRDIIKIRDVKDTQILEEGIGYIRLAEFRETTPTQFCQALTELRKQGLKGLILDLRSNPGGLLEAAVKVAENFVENDFLIVSTVGRKGNQNMELRSSKKDADLELPLVVLVNEGSASGSEIVAACLKDYKRAIIIGKKTFGKGSVQSVIPLGDGSAIRLTTSKYFSPEGNVIHGKGVMPDIVVEPAQIQVVSNFSKEPSVEIFRKVEEAEGEEETEGEDKTEGEKEKYKNDRQLMRAVDALKAICIYRQRTD